jgi:hypothetical protein
MSNERASSNQPETNATSGSMIQKQLRAEAAEFVEAHINVGADSALNQAPILKVTHQYRGSAATLL